MARRKPVDISEERYEEALAAREQGTTKKAQCEILGIAYNTKRLDTLLEEYLDEKAHRKEMVKKFRSKPITQQDDINFVEAYLLGDSFDDMAKRFYRSTALIKRRLDMAGVTGLRFVDSANPRNPKAVPDEAMAESFEIGQKVWVPGYKCLGEVKRVFTGQPDGVAAYRVYLLDSSKHRNVTYKAYDLGCLKFLENLGVNTSILEDNMDASDIKILLSEALKKARMTANKAK